MKPFVCTSPKTDNQIRDWLALSDTNFLEEIINSYVYLQKKNGKTKNLSWLRERFYKFMDN